MSDFETIAPVLQAGAPDSFCLFCYWYDYDFFKRRPFLKEIAQAFQWVYDEYQQGSAVRISVSLPPRSGKSYITSLFCAWWLGKLPELSVMRNTCTATLYKKFSYDVRSIVRSRKFRAIFPDVELAPDKQNVTGWNLTLSKQVGYFGAGVGGTIIGFGSNLAITDDLYPDIEHALSLTYNDSVKLWKESAHDSRKEKNCPEIFIGTRWTKNDVIGQAQEKGRLHKEVSIAALTEDRKSFCEDVKSTAEYLEIQGDIDEVIWEAEYQQAPIENKGTLFPRSTLRFYDPAQVDLSQAEYAYMQMDAADEGGDFYAAPACVLIENIIYIPEVIFNTNGIEVTEPDTIALARKWNINAAQFEGNGGWVSMGKSIRKTFNTVLPDCDYRIIKNTVNKETRILAQSGFVKRNIAFRSDYEQFPEYKRFIQNLIAYMREGGNKHDDAPDVLAGVAKYFSNHFPDAFAANNYE